MEATLAAALTVVRQACQRSERVTMDGNDDTHFLGQMLVTTGDELRLELAVVDVIQAASTTMSARAGGRPLTEEADASLRLLLPQIAAFYTMAQERVIHANVLLSGMEATATEIVTDDDDGLF